nr:hypothetical protein [Corynebacterium ulcerans]
MRKALGKSSAKTPRKSVIGEESSGVYVKGEAGLDVGGASSAGRGRRRVARRVTTAAKRN